MRMLVAASAVVLTSALAPVAFAETAGHEGHGDHSTMAEGVHTTGTLHSINDKMVKMMFLIIIIN